MVTRLSLAFLALSTVAFGADVIDQFARQGRALITDAEIKGQQVRQCTCAEQTECVEGMKTQAMACVESCWNGFNDVSHISDLAKDRHSYFRLPTIRKTCASVLLAPTTCSIASSHASSRTCLAEKSDVMIQKVNISELLRLGVERIEKTKIQLTKTLAAPIRKIVDTAGSFGLCVKECFQKKNAQGFCFDQKKCQPLIMDKKARKSLRRCTKAIDWKKEAGELCDCSVKAGIS
ncbi:Protein C39E9.8 c [Aphelenchoides avenae]|nr:Protein C39E9.8 c [Aphelenchus avenae]